MSGRRVHVVVLSGGPDAERAVSLASGCAVADALRETGSFRVSECVIDRPGTAELSDLLEPDDVVFPALHGKWGEGGTLQAMLEQLGVAFVGSGSKAAAVAMDKQRTKDVLEVAGWVRGSGSGRVGAPESQVIGAGDVCTVALPLVLKPNDDGSSVDLRICHTQDELEQGRAELHGKRGSILAERYVRGREITVGVLHDEALPVMEIVPASGSYDYEAKYERDDTVYVINPDLPAGMSDACRAAAARAHAALGCRDLSRADFMVEVGAGSATAWFLEINTMPGFTSHSLLPMAAKSQGLTMADVVRQLVERALARGRAASVPA